MSVPQGYARYERWYDKYPITDSLVVEMFCGQCDCSNHVIFDETAPPAWAAQEDILMERLRLWFLQVKKKHGGTITNIERWQPIHIGADDGYGEGVIKLV